ncbi:hypothetical protein GQX73_g4200 [Xylaria multiplex]|uniref:Uncharacterized protein n=1 Tax=Xylaria multiplex TaxID=323545 RepID=A0A7C8MSF7_9PEZI|nr:hypothetical protein GQX73_g4200 [Xylaria multiplex]
MGRHEPLTSLALGRSPYDDVVAGEGEADPQEPVRRYDEHGRVVNEESKNLNKDIIRAHNEVMLVIGVAEQEPSGASVPLTDPTRMHNEYENNTGRYFLRLGRVLVVAGIWGVHGVRQRILVSPSSPPIMHINHIHVMLRAIIGHIRFHLQIYVAMQRLDLIPGSRWFPSLNFFIPFSSSSPFMAPPPLGSPGAQNLSEWAGNIAMGLAPYVGYYLIGTAWDVFSYFIRRRIHKTLPHPVPSSNSNARTLAPTNTPRRQSFPESPTLGDADQEIRHTQTPEADGDSLAMSGEGVGEPLPVGTIRRQGTFSSRGGDDYATDEEDPEMVNPTLISFDVDTSESTEPPAGVWSAELRPSNSGDPRSQEKEAPKYMVNTLTSLPSLLAGDILTSSLTHALLTPFDILAFRAMARAFSLKFGLPIGQMFKVSLADGLATRMMPNLIQAEVLKFVICFGTWAIITGVAQRFHVTDEEWSDFQLEMARELDEALGSERS